MGDDLVATHKSPPGSGSKKSTYLVSMAWQDCIGVWCPSRRIPGLLLIHAWNPNDMNTLTSDHVKSHFVRPGGTRFYFVYFSSLQSLGSLSGSMGYVGQIFT